MIHSVTDLNFREEVLASSIPVLVNFGAPWCGLCQLIQPTLIQFHDRWDEQIKLVNINADDNLKLASTYKLKSLPTLILFTNGRMVHRLEGFKSRDDLRDSLDQMTKIATMSWQIGDRGIPMRIDWSLVSGSPQL
jgi:thioredoxin 1